MNMDKIIEEIKIERDRQHSLPGSEWDKRNTPGDWVSIISHYSSGEVRRNGINPNADDFKDSLIKSAAVIIACLENLDEMISRNELN